MGNLLGRRMLLVTGKGGVGKTTVAAALVLAAAADRRRVLCAEVWGDTGGAPHDTPLMRALGAARVSDVPSEVLPGVHGVLLTPTQGHKQFLHQVLPRLLVDAALHAPAIRRFLAAAPAIPEMGLMYQLLDLLRRQDREGRRMYDLCVVDAPATGHALALAQIPAMLLEVIPHGRIGATAREGLGVLTDPASTGAVVVTLPEALPVSETLELCRGLADHRIPLGAVIANRIPEDPLNPSQRAALEGFLKGRSGPGTRLLARAEAAGAALRGLSTLAVPVARVNEEAAVGAALARRVQSALAVQGVLA